VEHVETIEGQPLGRREEAKNERREKILRAVESLARRRGGFTFSMRELADEAGVAFKTPFNLFGSRGGVLAALADRHLLAVRDQVLVRKRSDPIDRLFQAARASVEIFTSDEDLYRPLYRSIAAEIGDLHTFDRGSELWALALEEAIEAGLVDPPGGPMVLGRAMDFAFRGVFWQWATGEIEAREFSLSADYTVAVHLLGVASSDRAREKLSRKLKSVGKQISRLLDER